VDLPHGGARIGDRAECERAEDAVEAGVGEVECLGVADPQIRLPSRLCRPPFRDRQHLGAQLDPGQRHVVAVVGQVAPGADRDLEDLTLRPRAGPLAAALEEQPVEDPHLAVVAWRLLVLEAADPLRLPPGVLGQLHLL